MRFYLDEDISSELAWLLRDAGHDVLTTSESRLRANPDSDQLLRAWAEQRILVTHNRGDFVLLHLAWSSWPYAWAHPQTPLHAGIAIIHQPPRLTHLDAATALSELATSQTTLTNEIVRLQASGEWVPMRWRSSG